MPRKISLLGALLWTAAPLATSAQAATTYSLTDLGDFPGGTDRSEALDLNASGAVVGFGILSIGPGASEIAGHGFLWQNGVMTDLGDLPGGADASLAVAINASGQVVGYSETTAGRRPFLWQSDVGLIDLSMEPGNAAFLNAADINDVGQVVGSGQAQPNTTAYLWQSGSGLTDLGRFEGMDFLPFATATAINASGFVVGWGKPYLTANHGMSWAEAGMPADLGELPGGDDSSGAFDVNDAGQIVGRSTAGSGYRAVLWDGGPPIDLGELTGGESSTEALGINNLGEIVGVSAAASGNRGVLWDDTGGPYDLNDRLDASGAGYEIFRADAINDAGQIAANATIGGVTHGVLLTPAPEPAALAQTLTSVGALLFGALRARPG